MQAKKHLIVVGGPTASGKTSTAIALARHFDTAIISADSRQFFREMSIGTAKPSAQELAQAPHYFIDSHSVTEEYSVGTYEREVLALLRKLYQEKDVLILAGGSGLYINALCQGLDEFPDVPVEIKQFYETKWEQEGLEYLQEELRQVDSAYAKTVDLQNPHRLIRALSVCRASGRPYSSFRKKGQHDRFFTPTYIQMDWDRDQLYERINQRVELMVKAGLEDEVRSLLEYKDNAALATVGYQEWLPYFDGEIDRISVIDLIKRNSRRYAKRQLTWMRRDGFWRHFAPKNQEAILTHLDWRIHSNYELISRRQGEAEVLTYEQGNQPVAQISIEKTKRFILARVQILRDEKALEDLLDEFLCRVGKWSPLLIIPAEVELSTHKWGFVDINIQYELPKSVLDRLAPSDSLLQRK